MDIIPPFGDSNGLGHSPSTPRAILAKNANHIDKDLKEAGFFSHRFVDGSSCEQRFRANLLVLQLIHLNQSNPKLKGNLQSISTIDLSQ